MSGIID